MFRVVHHTWNINSYVFDKGRLSFILVGQISSPYCLLLYVKSPYCLLLYVKLLRLIFKAYKELILFRFFFFSYCLISKKNSEKFKEVFSKILIHGQLIFNIIEIH